MSGHVVVPPYADLDVDENGSCTAALNAFVKNTTNGTLFEFPVGERYKSDGTFLLAYRSGDTFEFNGSALWTDVTGDPLVRATRSRAHVRVNSCDRVNLLGLRVEGPHAAGAGYNSAFEGQHGVDIESSSQVVVTDCAVSGVWGDGVYVSRHGYTGGNSNGVYVADFSIENTGRHAFGISSGEWIEIAHGSTDAIRRAFLDLELNGRQGSIRHVHVHDVTVGSHGLNFVAGVSGGVVEDVLVEDVWSATALQSNLGTPVDDWSRKSDFTFRNLTSSAVYGGNGNALLRFTRVSNVAVENVQARFDPRRTAMRVARMYGWGELTVDGVEQELS